MRGAALAKKRKSRPHRPEVPVAVDWGPDTPAQRVRARYDDARDLRGYQVHGKKRPHILLEMRRTPKRPGLSPRQVDAGLIFWRLYERQHTTPERTGVYVDFTPDPSAAAVLKAQRAFDFSGLSRHVPHGMREVVMHVCAHDRAIRDGLARNGREADMYSAMLKVALDVLANELGLWY